MIESILNDIYISVCVCVCESEKRETNVFPDVIPVLNRVGLGVLRVGSVLRV